MVLTLDLATLPFAACPRLFRLIITQKLCSAPPPPRPCCSIRSLYKYLPVRLMIHGENPRKSQFRTNPRTNKIRSQQGFSFDNLIPLSCKAIAQYQRIEYNMTNIFFSSLFYSILELISMNLYEVASK